MFDYQHFRFKLIKAIFVLIAIILMLRMIYLAIIDHQFLMNQSNIRVLKTITIPTHRGMILDRYNKPLAVSIAVDSIWIDPKRFKASTQALSLLAKLLDIKSCYLINLIKNNNKKRFVYVKRNVSVAIAKQVQNLSLPGLYLQPAYKRYYTQGEITAHILGFTNIDDQGQEGLELQYNHYLQGIKGKEKVLQDRLGHIIGIVSILKSAKPGKSLRLSIDERLQYLAYRVLKKTIHQFQAQSGSVIILNPHNGEILALVNQPCYDPNHRFHNNYDHYRNRALTDMFEPGSTMKTFSIASALSSNQYRPTTTVDTGNGVYHIGSNTIHDDSANGIITVSQILQRSSNIGAAKLTLSLPPSQLLSLLYRVGFGQKITNGFPGESRGFLPPDHKTWRPIDLATLAFGYGLTVTTLQLVHAYGIIANNGISCPVTFIKRSAPVHCIQAIKPHVAHAMLMMLHTVVETGGTGTRARIANYHVAGKTGTAYIAKPKGGGYYRHAYTSSFVGMAPLSNPKLVVAVVISKPQGQHFGALVAAPAFAKIMAGALDILDIAPDKTV